MFSLTLYRIETSLPRMVLISTFWDLVNRFAIWFRNFLTFSSLSIMLLMLSRIECFMIMRLIRLKHSLFKVSSLFNSTVISKGGSVRNPRLFRSHALYHVGCMQIYPTLSKSFVANKQVFKNNMNTIENTDLENKLHTFHLDVPKSILIDVDNSKVIMDLVDTMIFFSITLPCV